MKSTSRNVLSRFVKVAFIFPLFSMSGPALADVSSFSIHPDSNVLGVDPSNGDIFLSTLGSDLGRGSNLLKHSSDGSLIYAKRVELGISDRGELGEAVVVNNNLYVNVLEEVQGNLFQNITQLNGDGEALSSFAVDGTQRGLTYIPASNTFISINYYANRTNPTFVEFALDGSTIQSYKIDDPFLNTPRGHAYSPTPTYNPFTQSIFALYGDQNPVPQYNHGLAEYKLGLDGQYHVGNIYDTRSVGIEWAFMSMDINRSDGQFMLTTIILEL